MQAAPSRWTHKQYVGRQRVQNVSATAVPNTQHVLRRRKLNTPDARDRRSVHAITAMTRLDALDTDGGSSVGVPGVKDGTPRLQHDVRVGNLRP